MKDVEKMFDEAYRLVASVVGENGIWEIERPITLNSDIHSCAGRCFSQVLPENKHRCRIEIDAKILTDTTTDEAVMNVLIHEILHACKWCTGHGHKKNWKLYADRINQRYPQYQITIYAGENDFGDEVAEERLVFRRKYELKCTKCGKSFYSSRLTKDILHPEIARCFVYYDHKPCCGKLIRVK